MGNSQGKQQLNRGRSKSKLLISLKRSKSQPVTSTTTPATSTPTTKKYTKREDKRPVDPDEEDEDFNDILSDEGEFSTASFTFYEEEDITIVYNEGTTLLNKQKLLLLQIEVIRNVQDMCDVSIPIAAIILQHHNWDKDILIEKWIENMEEVCKVAGVLLPLVSKREDTCNVDDIFVPFKQERRPPPLMLDVENSVLESRDSGGSFRILDIIRPFLVNRGPDAGDEPLNITGLLSSMASSSNSNSNSNSNNSSARRNSSLYFPPLPPASPRVPRRNRSHQPSRENLEDMEVAAVQLSLISQVQELFPELDDQFVAVCLQEYRNSSERVVHHILEGSLHPNLAERLRQIRTGATQLLSPQPQQPQPAPPAFQQHRVIIEEPQQLQREEAEEERVAVGSDDGAGGEQTQNDQTYYLDGMSTNVASDPQFHSTVGTHEDFTENPNAWFSATHTEAENESLDSMSTTATFTYNRHSLSLSRYGTPTPTPLMHIRSLPHNAIMSEVFLHTEGTEEVNNDTHLTSENTSCMFDNDSEDEDELVVRRKSKAGTDTVYDMSEDANGMSEGEDDAKEYEGAEPTQQLARINEESEEIDIEREHIGIERADIEEIEEEIEIGREINGDESWRDFVKIVEPEVVQNDKDVYIVLNEREDDSNTKKISSNDASSDNTDNNDDMEIIVEVPADDDEVEKDIKDIDLCMKDIANVFVDDASDHNHANCISNDDDNIISNHTPVEGEGETEVRVKFELIQSADMVTCPVCYVDIPAAEAYGLACGHQYCMECWQSHLQTKLGEGLIAVLNAACMYPHCKASVDILCWKKALAETQFLKYQWLFLKSFVDNCPKAAWCTNPVSCGNAAYYQGVDIPKVLLVKCDCGWKFCFHCGEEGHQPCTCKQLSSWQALRSGEEGQNAVWLSHNTKRCPQCSVHIEKNEGCMHLTCKVCRHEFCWMCKGPWAEHGDKTGGYYSCNRYDPLRHDTPDLDLRFGKYVHHFQRFNHHSNARKVAENRRPDITTREPSSLPGDEVWDRSFLYEVLDLIVSCRTVLKYTYVFGYYLEESKEKELFEFLQEDLEKSTEYLTELTFREIENIVAPISERECIVLLKNSAKVTRKFLHNLLNGIQNGLTAEYGPPADVIATRAKGKKLKDRKISRLLTKTKLTKPTPTPPTTPPPLPTHTSSPVFSLARASTIASSSLSSPTLSPPPSSSSSSNSRRRPPISNQNSAPVLRRSVELA